MAEAMTVESMIQAYWHMEHYFTIPRFSFLKEKVKGSGYSDIDLLAYKAPQWVDPNEKIKDQNRCKNILVLCESKAHGEKNKIKYDDYSKEKFVDFESLKDETNQHDLIKFYFNVAYIIANGSLNNLIDVSNLDVLKLQFISTALFSNEVDVKTSIEKKIMNVFIEKKISIKPGFTVEIELITHFDIINKLFLQVQRDESGKRYGNPVLDFIRELNRYINVNHCDGITSIVDIDVKPDDNQKHDKYDLLKMLFQKEFFSTLKNENKSYKSISKKINHITKAKESKK